MNWLLVLIVIVLAIKLFQEFSRKPKAELKAISPDAYYKKTYLLTKAEHEFFKILQQILEDKYYIFPQVHYDSLLGIKSGQTYWDRRAYRSRVDRKSADFVICDKQKIEPLLVIELDDSSHNYYKRKERDGFIDDILQSANLKILHIKTSYSYDPYTLREAIHKEINKFN